MGEKRRELETELKMKQQLLSQLVLEAERVGKEAHRSAYTRRILEIIGNVEKQKLEISKVLKDTQGVQKEINTLSGQLDRCFTVADETIFAVGSNFLNLSFFLMLFGLIRTQKKTRQQERLTNY